jgi:carboxylesterase type B
MLGALGFLVTGLEPDQIQGNFGIMDQKLAIKWVHENIQTFGGDNDKVSFKIILALQIYKNF